MAWIELSQQAVKARLSRTEFDDYISAAERSTDFDLLGEIIKQVVALVRSKVRACKANIDGMGADGTIPEECLHAAATIAKASLCASFPVASGETDLRREELRQANAYLDSVASCSISIAGSGGNVPGTSGVAFGGDRYMDFRQ